MRYVALLRGINVGGHKSLCMADLRALLETLGFTDVRSLLQSGNLVFQTNARSGRVLEQLLESKVKAHLGMNVDFLIRSAREWENIVARNPLADQAARSPNQLVAMCLKDSITARKLADLQEAIVGRELIGAKANQLYIFYPDGIGRSRLTHTLIEKTLATRGTARNWNTVLKIASAIASPTTSLLATRPSSAGRRDR